MSDVNFILVEDDEKEIESFITLVDVYMKKNPGLNINIKSVKSVDGAKNALDDNNSFDGAIIDLNLEAQGSEGNVVIREILEKYRIPIAVFTGTPGNISDDINKNIVKIFRRDGSVDDLISYLINIFNTGVTKIMRGSGTIETTMNNIFKNNILPKLDTWVEHVNSGKNTENALLRYIINHAIEELLHEEGVCVTDETYIEHPVAGNIKTGCIVESKVEKIKFMVLSPACDLVLREPSKKMKTTKILLCEIDGQKQVVDEALDGVTNEKKKIKKLTELFKNNTYNYYHWLPETKFFNGGFVNFRHSVTYTESEFYVNFEKPELQTSSYFTKDIVSRFSTYYARQGQPDFEFEELAKQYLGI